jgi:MYXO-CTERM domain-containing protein
LTDREQEAPLVLLFGVSLIGLLRRRRRA